MTTWKKRVTPKTGVTFLQVDQTEIVLLVPPGSAASLRRSCPQRSGRGLWLLASWCCVEETPSVDLDPPRHARNLDTREALRVLDKHWHDQAALLIKAQLEQAWALSSPSPFHALEERRTLQLSSLLMQLHREARDAFPDDRFWRPSWPAERGIDDAELQALLAPTASHYCPRCAAQEQPLRARQLLRAFTFTLRMKWSQRPGLRPSALNRHSHQMCTPAPRGQVTATLGLNEQPLAGSEGVTRP